MKFTISVEDLAIANNINNEEVVKFGWKKVAGYIDTILEEKKIEDSVSIKSQRYYAARALTRKNEATRVIIYDFDTEKLPVGIFSRMAKYEKGRGRPKIINDNEESDKENDDEEKDEVKSRGRPKKVKDGETKDVVKKSRGRPKKKESPSSNMDEDMNSERMTDE